MTTNELLAVIDREADLLEADNWHAAAAIMREAAEHLRAGTHDRRRIIELEKAMRPFSKFWESLCASHGGRTEFPQSFNMITVKTSDGPVAITVEDLKNAHRVSMKP